MLALLLTILSHYFKNILNSFVIESSFLCYVFLIKLFSTLKYSLIELKSGEYSDRNSSTTSVSRYIYRIFSKWC